LKKSKTSYLKWIRTHQKAARNAKKSFEISRHLYRLVSTYTEIEYVKGETKQQIAQPKDHLFESPQLYYIRNYQAQNLSFNHQSLYEIKLWNIFLLELLASVEARLGYKQ